MLAMPQLFSVGGTSYLSSGAPRFAVTEANALYDFCGLFHAGMSD